MLTTMEEQEMLLVPMEVDVVELCYLSLPLDTKTICVS